MISAGMPGDHLGATIVNTEHAFVHEFTPKLSLAESAC